MLTEAERQQWDRALLLPGESDLPASILKELCAYTRLPAEEVEARCVASGAQAAQAWQSRVQGRGDVDRFYEEYEEYLFRFAPLGTIYGRTALCLDILERMRAHGGTQFLDYGSGIGTAALFFRAMGLQVTLADISAPLLEFCRWRFAARQQAATFLDLRQDALPKRRYDFVLAFDVLEHLRRPWEHLRLLARVLRPGGLLFVYSPFGEDAHDPLHIVRDTRTLDLAPWLGLEVVNCSPYRFFTPSGFFVFRAGQSWGAPRLLALAAGGVRYGLKRLKNGPLLMIKE